jgi:hypothetical protein
MALVESQLVRVINEEIVYQKELEKTLDDRTDQQLQSIRLSDLKMIS